MPPSTLATLPPMLRPAAASGNPRPVSIAPGVVVRLPSWKDLRPDGTLIEGRGIDPDVPVLATPDQLRTADPVLDAALAWLRS
jgi:C-terminal processing protease CtpA/Prc